MGRWDIVESSESRSEVNQVRASTGPYIVVKALVERTFWLRWWIVLQPYSVPNLELVGRRAGERCVVV